MPDTQDYGKHSPFNFREGEWLLNNLDENAIKVGQETLSRSGTAGASQLIVSGYNRLTYFTATKSEVVSQVKTYTGGTAAGATPTLCRVGLYKVEANNDLTLIASIPNDTTLWATSSTEYPRNFSAPVAVVAGSRYAIGVCIVTAASTPNFAGISHNLNVLAIDPRITGLLQSQTDLASSISAASVEASATAYYASILP